jgi:hypothetical protein
MAQAITQRGLPDMTVSVFTASVPDQTATTAGQDAGSPMRKWRASIYQKAFAAGTGTVGPIYALEVADNSAMSTNLRTVDVGQPQRLNEQQIVLEGTCLVAPQQFGRVKLTLSGTDTATFDCFIQAA